MGLVDNINVLAVRDANLQPLPLGTFIIDHTTQWAPYFYLQDSWRVSQSLTLSLGLSYGWQTSPTETHNLQTVRAVEAFEESIHSLNAAVHMLTIRAKAHAA